MLTQRLTKMAILGLFVLFVVAVATSPEPERMSNQFEQSQDGSTDTEFVNWLDGVGQSVYETQEHTVQSSDVTERFK